ncbi:MAG: zinc ABC transporter substrate-binding protein [Phycisphaeraceae bacterium]|nr:zinc ABC transporter substrate-binding protein [Phycisphaeraceae bacterium]
MLHFVRLLIMAALLLPAACSKGPQAPQTRTAVTIVCTTGMIADAARNIAAEHATVTALMGTGVDPHLYKPTRSDMALIAQADIVFYNGLHLEGKMIDALQRAASSGRRVFPVAEHIDASQLLSPAAFQGAHDPHIWMSPPLWSRAVEDIRDRLIEHDPDHAPDYTANARRYLDQLAQLDAYANRVIASIPESSRVLVTAHDAFNYMGRQYNLEVVGIQGISTESEAGVRDIERIVDLLVNRKIKAVFVETTVAERNIKALIAGAAQQSHTVIIGGSLYSDAMGAENTYEGTYIGMIDHNLTTIARALGGDAPPRGMNGQLTESAHQ